LGATIINRFVIRTIQRLYAQRGRGLHRTLIVGTGSNAKIAFDDLMRNKILGMEVIGYIQVNGKGPDAESGIYPEDVIGQLSDIDRIIAEYKVQDVLVAVEANGREDLVAIISKLDNPDVRLKLLPDFYQIVSGLSKTNQIFGMPIIEISPEPMPLWEKAVKRLMDVTISVVVLIVLAPFLLLVALFIRLGSPGPVIFRQERIGRNGKPFVMNKFRTMVEDAERKTGPMWAKKNDPRITKIGYWLRKLRIDELPQLYNVIRGQMSLVGPRPEREHFVEQFKDQIPLYMRRLRVRPGITGWAQVKWKYDASLDDVKEKTKYDLYYVENISLRMDIKIIINTLITMIKGKGQ
jgi:exopolysaccharide biosynthesis polyprenyl glycosylphosphotransferase